MQIDKHLEWEEPILYDLRTLVQSKVSLNMPSSYCHMTLSVKCIVVSLNRNSATAVQFGAMWGMGRLSCRCCKNRAARIVTNSSYDSSASALIEVLNRLSAANMTQIETAFMDYKSIIGLAPDKMSEICTKKSEVKKESSFKAFEDALKLSILLLLYYLFIIVIS